MIRLVPSSSFTQAGTNYSAPFRPSSPSQAAHDRDHRRPRRSRQKQRRPRAGSAAWLPLPRYRGDVPRGHPRRQGAAARPRPTPTGLLGLWARFPSSSPEIGSCSTAATSLGQIRTFEITTSIQYAADNPAVRAQLVVWQRAAADGFDVVTEGRDQGTVVFPDAECKIFLTADEDRASRAALSRPGQPRRTHDLRRGP